METKNYYCGLDIHKDNYVACLIDEKGNEIHNHKFSSLKEDIRSYFLTVPKNTIVIIENCGMWYYAYKIITQLGYKVILADASATKKLPNKKKTDQIDAKALANLKRNNFLPELHIPSEEILKYRDLIHHLCAIRDMFKEIKTRIKNELLKHGIPYKKSIWNSVGLYWLKALNIDTITSLVYLYENTQKEEKIIHNKVKKVSNKLLPTKLLMTIPGIGEFLALLIYSEISTISRFANPKNLVMYSGLCPSIYQTGNTEFQTKNYACNKLLKRGFYQGSGRAAIMKKDNIFKQKYNQKVNQKNMSVARRVIARHLATVVWNMLMKNQEFKY